MVVEGGLEGLKVCLALRLLGARNARVVVVQERATRRKKHTREPGREKHIAEKQSTIEERFDGHAMTMRLCVDPVESQ